MNVPLRDLIGVDQARAVVEHVCDQIRHINKDTRIIIMLNYRHEMWRECAEALVER